MARQDLTLASATLSGGAVLSSAGGGFPQRITIPDDKFFSSASIGAGQIRPGVVMDPDGLHFWVPIGTAAGANTGLRKIRISDGATITTITGNSSDGGTRTIATPMSITRRGSKIYSANSGSGNYLIEVDTSTLICRMYAQATVTTPYHVVSDGTNLWARNTPTSFGTYQEFTLSGTGDTATATATANTVTTAYEMFVDNAGTFAYFVNSSNITKYTLATHTVSSTYTPASSGNFAGYNSNSIRGGVWDHVEDKLVVHNTGTDTWWYVNSTFNGPEKQAFGPYAYGGVYSDMNNTSPARNSFAWADDDSKIVLCASDQGVTPTVNFAVKVRTLGIQRARWTWTPGSASTLRRISFPGETANIRGALTNMPLPALFTTAVDFRKTRIWYSVNGGSRTEYLGEELALALAAGDVLTVDVDMQHAVEHPHAFPPFIGGANGEGGFLIYDTISPRRARILGGM